MKFFYAIDKGQHYFRVDKGGRGRDMRVPVTPDSGDRKTEHDISKEDFARVLDRLLEFVKN